MRDDVSIGARQIVAACFSMLTMAIAAWGARSVFDQRLEIEHVLLGVPLAGVIALATVRLPWIVRAVVAVVVSAGAGALAILWSGAPFVESIRRLPVSGLGDIIASTWPAPPATWSVAAITVLVALGSFVAVQLVVVRSTAAAIVPSLAVLGVMALLSAPGGPPDGLRIAAFGASAVLTLASGRGRPRPDMIVWTAAVLVLAVGLPLALAPSWTDDRYDVRDVGSDLPERLESVTPLARLGEWRSLVPPTPMFTTSAVDPASWRVVALDRFDGIDWLPADDYRSAGLPDRTGVPGVTSIEVTIDALDTLWLPMLDTLVGLSVPHQIDGSGGSLLADVAPVRGDVYEIEVVPTALLAAELVGTSAAEGDSPLTDEVEVPASVTELASVVTAGATSDFDRAQRLATYLQTEYALDPTVPPGHSLGVLDVFLSRTKRGNDEQFVAAYALLAASVGLPVRVAVGFSTVASDDGGTVAMSDGAAVWAEIDFEGAGWVRFDPIPDEIGTNDAGTGTGAIAPTEDPSIPPPTTTPAGPPPSVPESTDESEVVAPPDAGVPGRTVAVSIGVMLLLSAVVGYVMVIVWMKRRRRNRRRHDGDSNRLALGAFETGVDVVVDLGSSAPASTTPHELVAQAVDLTAGSAQLLDPVARRATAAVFDPRGVSSTGAQQAWECLEDFERATAGSVGRWRWTRARMSTRSLRRRRRG